MRFDLSDEDWAVLEQLMPESRKSARADARRIMNAIFYVRRTGMGKAATRPLPTAGSRILRPPQRQHRAMGERTSR